MIYFRQSKDIVETIRRTLTPEEIDYVEWVKSLRPPASIYAEDIRQKEKDKLMGIAFSSSERILSAYQAGDGEAEFILKCINVWRKKHFGFSHEKRFVDFVGNRPHVNSMVSLIISAAIGEPDRKLAGKNPYNQISQLDLLYGIISYAPKPITELQN